MEQSGATDRELTEAEKRANVVRLALDNDSGKLDTFVQLIKKSIPDNTGVVLRGSAVTGFRWTDGAAFHGDGPGTSDPCSTLPTTRPRSAWPTRSCPRPRAARAELRRRPSASGGDRV